MEPGESAHSFCTVLRGNPGEKLAFAVSRGFTVRQIQVARLHRQQLASNPRDCGTPRTFHHGQVRATSRSEEVSTSPMKVYFRGMAYLGLGICHTCPDSCLATCPFSLCDPDKEHGTLQKEPLLLTDMTASLKVMWNSKRVPQQRFQHTCVFGLP